MSIGRGLLIQGFCRHFMGFGLNVKEMGSHLWVLSSRWTFSSHKDHPGCVENRLWEVIEQDRGTMKIHRRGCFLGPTGRAELGRSSQVLDMFFKV